MMTILWVVESGSRVIGVYSTNANAVALFNKLPDEEAANIRVITLDAGIDYLNAGYNCYRVEMYVNGDVKSIEGVSWDDGFGAFRNQFHHIYGKNVPSDPGNPYFAGRIYAKDEAHATSIMNEKRIQLFEL
jgi:hypothetical protein